MNPGWAQTAGTPPERRAVLVPALAGTDPPIEWSAALEAAWQRAVAQRETAGNRRRAEAERASIPSLWSSAPSLQLSHRDDRLHSGAGQRDTDLGISVPLWLPGQRTARTRTADAAVDRAQITERLARLRLAGEIREVGWQMIAAQTDTVQAGSRVETLAKLADDVRRRVAAGDLALSDALAIDAEHLGAVAMESEQQQSLRAAKARWAQLTGLSAVPAASVSPGPSGSPAPTDTADHPELHLARLSTELARLHAEFIRHSRRDAPEFSVGVRQDLASRSQGAQGSLVMGLRLPLATDDRNRPREVAAQADIDIAETQELRLREHLQRELAVAQEGLQSAHTQRDADLRRARLLTQRAALIRKAFDAGDIPLPDLLRALAAAADAESAVARRTAALGLAQARLQQALGLLP